jgi:hypothetical protein
MYIYSKRLEHPPKMYTPQPAIQPQPNNQDLVHKILLAIKNWLRVVGIMILKWFRPNAGKRSVSMLITHSLPIETPLTLQRCCHT